MQLFGGKKVEPGPAAFAPSFLTLWDEPDGPPCLQELIAMPYRSPPKRAKEYRRLAEECRCEANTMEDAACRKAMLDTADTWESLADYEDKTNPAAL